MLKWELSSYALEIPNDADWLFSTQSNLLQADQLIFEDDNEMAAVNINMPYIKIQTNYS